MSTGGLLQFRLRTMLISVTLLAILIWGVLKFIRPLIADVTVRDGMLFVHFSRQASEAFAPQILRVPTSGSSQSFSSIHDMYLSISLPSLAVMAGILITGSLIAYLLTKRVIAWRATRK